MIRQVFTPLFLVIIALFSVWPLFKVGYTANLGSLEPATLIMARRVAEAGIWGWEPRWYLGFPFRYAGPPLSWWVLGAVEKLGVFDLLLVYRVLKALALASFPVTFYFLARRVFATNDGSGSLATIKKHSAELILVGPVKGSSQPTSSFGKFLWQIRNRLSDFVTNLLPLRALAGTPSALATHEVYSERKSKNHVFDWRQDCRFSSSTSPLLIISTLASTVFLILLPSVGYLFPKFFQIGANFGFAPSWLQQEFSRSLGLAILPAVLVIYWRLLEKISHWRLLVAITATALLFLTDGVTALSFLVGVAVLLVIEGHRGEATRKATVTALALVLAFLIAAFWFTPGNLKVIAASPSISGIGLLEFLRTLVQAGVGLGPAILVVVLLKLLKKNRQSLGFILLWLLPFLAITLLFYLSNPDFLTEYSRFLPEIEMGVALIFAYLVKNLNSKFFDWKSITSSGILLILIVTLLYSLYSLPKRWLLFRIYPDITQSLEYQLAKWLAVKAKDQRVFLSGSTAFWLNEFAPDVWQVRGDIDQASTNPYWAKATHQIRYGQDSEESLLWLQALRVGYLVVHSSTSSEYYHDFVNPAKFDGICESAVSLSVPGNEVISLADYSLASTPPASFAPFEEVCRLIYDNGAGDRIYQLDSTFASVASLTGLKGLPKPEPKKEKAALETYTEWLRAGPPANLQRFGSNQLTINANVGKDQVVAVGVTYDGGWQVKDATGVKLATAADPLGNLVIYPKAGGDQKIVLTYREGPDLWVGILVSLASLIFIAFVLPKKLPRILERAERGWGEEED